MFETFTLLLAPSLLIVAACLFFLGGTTRIPRHYWGPLSLLVFVIAGGVLLVEPSLLAAAGGKIDHYDGSSPQVVIHDSLTRLFQMLSLVIGAMFGAMAFQDQTREDSAAEFYGLLMTLVAGLMLVASANELVLLFLSLELISLPTYVLLYLGRRSKATQESAVKYFLLSVMSAAVLLYGFSFLYGLTGSTNLSTIREVLRQTYGVAGGIQAEASISKLGILAVALIFSGLAFKLAAVPFHFYAPDVYQGTNSWNAGLLSIVPKAAGLIALIRILSHTMLGYEGAGEKVALILAFVTMTTGNVLALLQTNVRRMLAYSGVAHAGYMLVGIAVGFWEAWNPNLRGDSFLGMPMGVQAALFYVISYSIVSAGLFAILVYLGKPGQEVEHIEDLMGLWKNHPWLAICMTLFLFSLAGIPPLPGFWGKLALFGGALSVRGDASAIPYPSPWFIGLAVVGMINAAIGAVYYLRVIALMFLHDPLTSHGNKGGRPAATVVTLCAIVTVGLGLQSGPLFAYLRTIHPPLTATTAQVVPASPVIAGK